MAALAGEYGVNPAKEKKETKEPVKMRWFASGTSGGAEEGGRRSQRLRMACAM